MSRAYGRSTRSGSPVTVLWWPPRRTAPHSPGLAVSPPNWRTFFTCQSKNPCCNWSPRAGSPAPVQPDRQELGRRAGRQLRKGPQVHTHHHNRYRIESDCTARYHLLPNWRQALKGGTQPTIHSNETCSAKMELHHLAPNVKLFLGSYLSLDYCVEGDKRGRTKLCRKHLRTR
jgi:hypothetical protein